MTEIPKIQIDLDRMTIGHLEDLDSGKMGRILHVVFDIAGIEGVPEEEQREAIAALNWRALEQISDEIRAAIEAESNPEDDEGKN